MGKAKTDIEQNLPAGLLFDDAVKDKRVYMVDLSFMANIATSNRYLTLLIQAAIKSKFHKISLT